jgi:hypothetical protein
MANKRNETSQEARDYIQNLLSLLQGKVGNDVINRLAPTAVENILKLKLSPKEKSAWSSHRQKHINADINLKKAEQAEARKALLKEKKDEVKYELLGLSNIDLCFRIAVLHIFHKIPNQDEGGNLFPKKGWQAKHQLLMALTHYSYQEVSKITKQIKSFKEQEINVATSRFCDFLQTQTSDQETMNIMKEAFRFVTETNRGLKLLVYNDLLLTKLNDVQLVDLMLHIWKAFQNKNIYSNLRQTSWPDRLSNLGGSEEIGAFRQRMLSIKTSNRFTPEIKVAFIQELDEYLLRPKKPRRDHLGRPITE